MLGRIKIGFQIGLHGSIAEAVSVLISLRKDRNILNFRCGIRQGDTRDYQAILKKHILPVLGKNPINEINRLMIKKFLMDKANEGYSASVLPI